MFSIYKLNLKNDSYSSDEYFSSLELLCHAIKQIGCNIGIQNMRHLLSAEETIYDKYPVVVIGEYMHSSGTCILTVQEIAVND
jgi:hypothetical protein